MFQKLREIFGKGRTIQNLYKKHDYLTAYVKHSNIRAKKDPQGAIGGKWEIVGPLQFEFLTKNGLKPENTLLDFGCGTLRAGRFFIKYLNPTHYTGLDISDEIILAAKSLVKQEGLENKSPNLILNVDLDLAFNDIPAGKKFDFILAQSVFTHLFPEHIEEFFQNLHKVMHKNTVFFFTFEPSEDFERRKNKDFAQPVSFFENLCEKVGLTFERMEGYDHPSKQRMFKATQK